MSRRSRLLLLGIIPSHAALARPELGPVLKRGAWQFVAGMQIDADGAPMAYALPASKLPGLDDIRAAGTRGHWWGLACDAKGEPFIQGPKDPAPGYCVSRTALTDPTRLPSDPRCYVDASQVPYVVAPPDLVSRGVRMGDLAAVTRGPKTALAIVADVGPQGHYGEGSMELARLLNIPDSPRTGGTPRGVTYVIFPGSHSTPPWPRSVLEIQATAARLYAAWRGVS